jgi:hypothetical protein
MTTTTPPSTASPMYKQLHATTTEFVRCLDKDPSQPTRMDHARIRAVRSETNFEHSWGHNYLVSTAPHLRGVLDANGFLKHLDTMVPRLESWNTDITDFTIDETQKKAVVRGSYYMLAKGATEPVENDLVWMLWFEDDGKRVRKSIEFIDGAASGKLKESIMANMQKGS